jgi:hypothetical protein
MHMILSAHQQSDATIAASLKQVFNKLGRPPEELDKLADQLKGLRNRVSAVDGATLELAAIFKTLCDGHLNMRFHEMAEKRDPNIHSGAL